MVSLYAIKMQDLRVHFDLKLITPKIDCISKSHVILICSEERVVYSSYKYYK